MTHAQLTGLGRHRRLTLAVVLLAAFMQLTDVSIVNVAIPSIHRELRAGYAVIEWVVAGYQLAFAVVLITGGRLGDIFGRKRLFVIGAAGFTIASILCGMAPTAGILVGTRVLQGIAGALMFPQIFSIVQATFPAHERSKAFGAVAAVMGVATTAGPLLGGLLVHADIAGLGWRTIFLVNVPIGVIAVLAGPCVLLESRSPQPLRLDPIGMILVSAALFAVLYALTQGRQLGWPAWTLALIAAGLTMLGLFTLYERHKTRIDGSPLVVLGLFRQRAFVVGLLLSLIVFSAVTAFFFAFSISLQNGLGFTALHSSLTTTPWAACSAAASVASIRLAPRLGRTSLIVGSALLTLGMAGVVLTVHHHGTGLDSRDLIAPLAIGGLGMGSVVAPLVNGALSGIRAGDTGSASGVLSTVQQVGGAVGVVIVSMISFGLHTSPTAHTANGPVLSAGSSHALWYPLTLFTAGFLLSFLVPHAPDNLGNPNVGRPVGPRSAPGATK
ncbi:MFS transporter [Streptomyces sp. NPDC050523]|uniref:MFS transporter n=1 Tax=Streptomyces sp. NPDC050523 TaxID=3365622 RepID=UPI0037A19D58